MHGQIQIREIFISSTLPERLFLRCSRLINETMRLDSIMEQDDFRNLLVRSLYWYYIMICDGMWLVERVWSVWRV